ncbi:MAG: class I SAM-dependent methyltransferase, partial [Candidatus Nanopelagicales bacterium]
MDLDTASWLTSPAGAAAVAAAQAHWQASADSLATSSRLRRELPELDAAQVAAALGQAELRALAADRYGITGSPLLTREGLEQATRPEVADRRARLLVETGFTHVIDLTAGLGFDSAAFIRAGLTVTCIERSPEIAALLTANLPEATVIVGDCTDPASLDPLLAAMTSSTALFIDPARRTGRRTADGSRAQSERDPERWSPPLSFVIALADRGQRVIVKTTPGFAIDAIPSGWSAEWVSSDRTVVE